MRKLNVVQGLILILLFWCSALQAQVLDRIDVKAGTSDAEITVRFVSKIQYLRHGPQGETKDLRVFLRLVDSGLAESELMQDTLRAPKVDRVPLVTAIFPELRNGMLISFSQPTRYSLKPGADGRSIVVTVPLLPAPPGKPKSEAPATPAAAIPLVVPSPPASVPVPAASVSESKQVKAKPGQTNLAAPAAASKPVTAPAATSPAEPATATAVTPKAAIPPPQAAPAPQASTPPVANAVPPVDEYVPAQPERTPAETEAMALAYIGEARQALTAGNVPLAINRLNRILGLPATAQTEAAQALIGEAREASGDPFKAKAEYELYIKLFPTGPNLTKVKQRLAGLPKEGASPAVAAKPARQPMPTDWTYSGSLSAYYYSGKSQVETLTPPAPGELTFNKDTLSFVDQRSLITSLNLNARRRNEDSDTRLVVRDTDNRNDLDPRRSYNRLYSAYAEHNDRKRGYSISVGRQNPKGIGVLDRFDGIQGGYNLNADWRVNGVVGEAVEFGSEFQKRFYGGSVDFLALTGRPGISVYAIEQTLDKLVNRQAVGTEARYFDGNFSLYGTLDYDLIYSGLNIALLQGNYLDAGGNNYFFVIDHRRSPSYGLTNALFAVPGLTLKEAVATQGLDEVRRQVTNLSAMSDLFSFGVTHPLSENWQVGADYRLSSISSTPAVDAAIPLALVGTCLGTVDVINDTCVFNTPEQPGSGQSHVVTLQVIGNNFFLRNATGVASGSFIAAPTYRGQAYQFSYVLPLGEQWRLDSNLRYYTQRDDNGDQQDRWSPNVKLSYQWRSSLYLEGEGGLERSHTIGAGRDDRIERDYWYFGLRWDFR